MFDELCSRSQGALARANCAGKVRHAGPLSVQAIVAKNIFPVYLAMRQHMYANKTNSKAISIHEFVDKLLVKYNLENIGKDFLLEISKMFKVYMTDFFFIC